MAPPFPAKRRLVLAAAFALIVATAGTFATMSAQRGDNPARAAVGQVKAIAGELRGKVGPAGLQTIQQTLDRQSPAKAVQRAAQAVAEARAGGVVAPGRPGQASPKRGGWERRPFGIGEIQERRR